MNGDKKMATLIEDYNKPLKKLFKYDKAKALKFDADSRSKLQDQKGIFVIFEDKQPLFVGQAGGYMTGHKLTQKDLSSKLAQFNSKSDAGTAKFRKTFIEQHHFQEVESQDIRAEAYNLKFQYIKVKGNPSMINLLEILALEYANENEIGLYNFQ